MKQNNAKKMLVGAVLSTAFLASAIAQAKGSVVESKPVESKGNTGVRPVENVTPVNALKSLSTESPRTLLEAMGYDPSVTAKIMTALDNQNTSALGREISTALEGVTLAHIKSSSPLAKGAMVKIGFTLAAEGKGAAPTNPVFVPLTEMTQNLKSNSSQENGKYFNGVGSDEVALLQLQRILVETAGRHSSVEEGLAVSMSKLMPEKFKDAGGDIKKIVKTASTIASKFMENVKNNCP